jgi:excisionase family DNA binding protein
MPTGWHSTPIEAYLPLLMTKKQVAYLLSTSVWTVEDLTRKGHLIALTDGGRAVKYSSQDVLAYIAKHIKEKPPTD